MLAEALALVTPLDPLHNDGYQFWSGIGSDIFIVTGLLALGKHYNCHVNSPRFCWRIGHPVAGTGHRACRRHHPHMAEGKTSAQDIADQHEESGA